MKHNYLLVSTILFWGLGLTSLQAQTTSNSSGGNASGSGGSVSYSVGQVVYTINTGTNGSVVQGVQQPYEISIIIGLEEAKGINLTVSAYPNPTSNFLLLKVENFTNTNLSYQLFDLSGNILNTQKITGNETCIITSNLSPATYFLKVFEEKKEVKTFKIIKN